MPDNSDLHSSDYVLDGPGWLPTPQDTDLSDGTPVTLYLHEVDMRPNGDTVASIELLGSMDYRDGDDDVYTAIESAGVELTLGDIDHLIERLQAVKAEVITNE